MEPARGQCGYLGKGESYSKKQKTKNVERTTGQKIVNPQSMHKCGRNLESGMLRVKPCGIWGPKGADTH